MDINKEIFRRYKPERKARIVNTLTEEELLHITEKTILRMIKEAGCGDDSKERSKFKTLFLNNEAGNGYNSSINSIYNWKHDKVYLNVYIQGSDTDTYAACEMSHFLSRSESVDCAHFRESYLNGGQRIVVADYSRSHRAGVIREILMTYIGNKDAINRRRHEQEADLQEG